MRNGMHPELALLLERNGVSMGSEVDSKAAGPAFNYTDVLSKITEVTPFGHRTNTVERPMPCARCRTQAPLAQQAPSTY